MTEPELYAEFERLGIGYALHKHPAVYTVEESQRICGEIPGAHVKNLLLRNKKNELWLVCAMHDTPVNMKELAAKIDSGRLSFANGEQLQTYLGTEPGSVSVLAIVNDAGNKVRVVFDERVLDADEVNFHPLRNDATVTLRTADVLRFLEAYHHPPLSIVIPSGVEGPL